MQHAAAQDRPYDVLRLKGGSPNNKRYKGRNHPTQIPLEMPHVALNDTAECTFDYYKLLNKY